MYRVCHKAPHWFPFLGLTTYMSKKMNMEDAMQKQLDMLKNDPNINVWLEPV